MRPSIAARRRVGAAAAGFAVLIAPAHVRWFVSGSGRPIDPAAVFSPGTAAALGAAAAAVLVAGVLDRALRRRVAGPDLLAPERLRGVFAWIPLLLGVHAAVPLLASGVQLQLFVPVLPLPRTFLGGVVALGEIVVALAFVYGAFTRAAAALLAALFAVGLLLFPPILVLEQAHLLGIAALLYILGRGPYSLDALIGRLARPVRWAAPYAVPALRVLAGFSIMLVGLTEKVWQPDLSLAFLERYPFNFVPALGFTGFTNANFVLAAGIVETVVGAVLISGRLTRPVIALAWFPFNLTLPFLGWVELVGHLPIYGIMVVLLVWGGGADLRPYLKTLDDAEREAERRAA